MGIHVDTAGTKGADGKKHWIIKLEKSSLDQMIKELEGTDIGEELRLEVELFKKMYPLAY